MTNFYHQVHNVFTRNTSIVVHTIWLAFFVYLVHPSYTVSVKLKLPVTVISSLEVIFAVAFTLLWLYCVKCFCNCSKVIFFFEISFDFDCAIANKHLHRKIKISKCLSCFSYCFILIHYSELVPTHYHYHFV